MVVSFAFTKQAREPKLELPGEAWFGVRGMNYLHFFPPFFPFGFFIVCKS